MLCVTDITKLSQAPTLRTLHQMTRERLIRTPNTRYTTTSMTPVRYSVHILALHLYNVDLQISNTRKYVA